MQHSNRWPLVALALAGLGLSACASSSTFDNEAASNAGPARVQAVAGSPYKRIVLTPLAARRLGIRTAPVRAAGGGRKLVPYAAVLYDADGNAYAYASVGPLAFVRSPLAVDAIEGRFAVLRAGPRPGTPVVTVGAAELLGTEYGVQEG
ncbi:MAG: hypothetical protein QOI62_4013 [Solirubrobacteraceae bacterium]|jgi:hypothetical protein|nr:hypothetical protein [Solirubrobacteraceae bacterium]MEA2360753.1 hypothetical protein [Solirubrobacteraceae bacterium]MEA2395682.1 hypothetical protein [Solirubrobacteraceae bacterium]